MSRTILLQKNKGIFFSLLSTFLVSCAHEQAQQPLFHTASKETASFAASATCYHCFDSLMTSKLNADQAFKTLHNRMIVNKKPQDEDYSLLCWFLLRSDDAALNESMGEHLFSAFRADPSKQKEMAQRLVQFPGNIRDRLRAGLIDFMSIDIESYTGMLPFKEDFPYFTDSVSLSAVASLIAQQ